MSVMFLNFFYKCNDYEHQNTQYLDIIKISKFLEPNKCIH